MFSFLVAVTVSTVSFTESRIVWEMDLWACLRGVSLVVLVDTGGPILLGSDIISWTGLLDC